MSASLKPRLALMAIGLTAIAVSASALAATSLARSPTQRPVALAAFTTPADGLGGTRWAPTGTSCVNIPTDLHPMYSTSSEATRVPWAARSYNIAFSADVWHFDYCCNAGTATRAGSAGTATTRARSAGTVAVTSGQRSAKFKKGVGAWAFRGSTRALAKSGVTWYYTWNVNHRGITNARGVSFVPMVWGPGSVTVRKLRQARRYGHVLLTFNEPDLPQQADMTVTEALRLWPRLMATGMRLASPAVAGGAATPGSWLDRFMARAAHRHYRVNFIALHWYGGDFSSAAAGELESYIQAVWQRYHKPIWLTEFALWRFNPSVFPTPAQQAAFVTASTAMLQGLPYVWRYAWFALPATTGAHGDGTAGLFRPGAVATAAGRAFEQVDS